MNTYYDEKNIHNIYWAWCVKRKIANNKIIVKNNISGLYYGLQFSSGDAAQKIDYKLSNGINMSQLIDVFSEMGVDGKKIYIYLIQNGIIE